VYARRACTSLRVRLGPEASAGEGLGVTVISARPSLAVLRRESELALHQLQLARAHGLAPRAARARTQTPMSPSQGGHPVGVAGGDGTPPPPCRVDDRLRRPPIRLRQDSFDTGQPRAVVWIAPVAPSVERLPIDAPDLVRFRLNPLTQPIPNRLGLLPSNFTGRETALLPTVCRGPRGCRGMHPAAAVVEQNRRPTRLPVPLNRWTEAWLPRDLRDRTMLIRTGVDCRTSVAHFLICRNFRALDG
jgi:hypothetical protein